MIGKNGMINELIDISEGIRISRKAGTSGDICRASEIYKAYVEAYKSDDTLFTHLCALSAVYITGRIQGIREERAKKQTDKTVNPCAKCGTQSGTLQHRGTCYYYKCSHCGAQAIHASYICGDPAKVQRAEAETKARALTCWNRGYLI